MDAAQGRALDDFGSAALRRLLDSAGDPED